MVAAGALAPGRAAPASAAWSTTCFARTHKRAYVVLLVRAATR